MSQVTRTQISLGVVMDSIGKIKTKKDSTFAMLLEAQRRGWQLWYMEQGDLFLKAGTAYAQMQSLRVQDDADDWFDLSASRTVELDQLDVILMRKDPPFDMEYIYSTYLLEAAEKRGTLVINKASALRDTNEKLSTAAFPQCCTPSLVSRRHADFIDFIQQHGDVILKPLDGMGGASIFRVGTTDPNTNVVIETLTSHGQRYAMAQVFIPEISSGDKRILIVNGKAVPYALARVPKEGETRGNLAAGGTGHGVELNDRDQWIVEQVAPSLKAAGILFAGLDVIGDYLTEINVTSPTCIRELDQLYNLNISALLMDTIEEKLTV